MEKYEFYSVKFDPWGKWENNDGGFRLSWDCNIGFGTTDFFVKDGQTLVDGELMSHDFIKQLLSYFYSQCIRTDIQEDSISKNE